jgi:hypothetical protein
MSDVDHTIPVTSYNVADLVPYENNTKIHDDEQVERLANTIKEYGFRVPIIIDENGVIIAGHGRRMAVMKLGWSKVPVQIVKGWSEARKNAFRIAENKVTSDKYDTDAIMREVASMSEDDLRIFLPETEFKVLTEQRVDMNAFVEDIDSEMEAFDEGRDAAADRVDADKIATAKAFGFKQVTIAEQREIKHLMAIAEEETGRKGAEALIQLYQKNLGI